ncbi:MAG: serine/threonine protein kinase, partial [Deltaproteobacteria bacterium]|nr:serine/threonine protein kinase [Deltaproteobacteria bacterium]
MIFGKYQLLDQIAKGGMAEIFKAKSYGVEGFEKILVIKRILPFFSSDEKFVEMFVNEAKIAVSLNHANIVQIYDLGKAGEYYFIAMEYINGPDLSKIIENCDRQNSVIPLEIALFITSEIAKGLDYAHRQVDSNHNSLNIIHRDISPQNILLSTEGEVKITDFGIAKAKNAFMAEITQSINGNFSYMSPEQATGLSQDSRTDIFSTGAVLYKMLTGKNPLKKEPSSLIVDLIKEGEIIPPLKLMEGTKNPIPVKINDLILKALEFDPEKRFQTAAELYNAIIEFSVESEF